MLLHAQREAKILRIEKGKQKYNNIFLQKPAFLASPECSYPLFITPKLHP
jgi:hypothetical protein